MRYVLLLIICICSTSLVQAEQSSMQIPGWFMKNQGQFNNKAKYCLKSAQSNYLLLRSVYCPPVYIGTE